MADSKSYGVREARKIATGTTRVVVRDDCDLAHLLPVLTMTGIGSLPEEMKRSKRSRTTRMTAIPREALWSAALLRRFSPFRRFAASTLQRFNVSTPQRERAGAFTLPKLRGRVGAFTLLELLIVVGIIALLLVLMAPAFTTIKGGTDVTSSAYTIKDELDTARTYAKANNTYTWVGFAGSIGSTVTGNVALVVVASKDGTDLGTSVNVTGPRVDITTGVTPVGKVMRLDNAHIGDAGAPTNDGTDFESRASVNMNYRVGAAGAAFNSGYYFIEQGTQFDRWIRFSPRGEAVVNGGATQITQYADVGLLPTHGTALAAGVNPASGNLVAIQISGVGGNVRIYRR